MTAPIGITLGDPAGIGPEIAAKAVAAMTPAERAATAVIGSAGAFERAVRLIGADPAVADPARGGVRVHDIGPADGIPDGEISAAAGEQSFLAVDTAVKLAQAGGISVIVTAPLNKGALHAAGHHYDGHTGMLAALTGRKSSFMLLTCERFSTIHVSTHVSLAEAIGRSTPERIVATVAAGHDHLKEIGVENPRIAVAGLNPHCGEGGIFGTDEIERVTPGVEKARAQGYNVFGPIPGDTVFYRAGCGEFDLVVAQYHDQGHIPIKLIAFDSTVNVTLGLPIKRTSVDHGTAFDIAWKGVADHTNMQAAIAYARRIAGH